MERTVDAKAWKVVQVLAGSIVEALLIDYLLATPNPQRSVKDPLRLDLAEVISICRTEKILSDRAADLCSVIRSYRNLIHPGRIVRHGEQQPTENSARIAQSVVALIVEEISKTRRANFGLTADQTASKIVRDTKALVLLKHLLAEASEAEKRRLLMDLLPARYFENTIESDPFEASPPLSHRLEETFRVTLDSVSDETKRAVAEKFVQTLKDADGDYIEIYKAAFFRPKDLRFVPERNRNMVREHLLASIATTHTSKTIDFTAGLSAFLVPSEVHRWLDPIVRTLISGSSSEDLVKQASSQISAA